MSLTPIPKMQFYTIVLGLGMVFTLFEIETSWMHFLGSIRIVLVVLFHKNTLINGCMSLEKELHLLTRDHNPLKRYCTPFSKVCTTPNKHKLL